MDARECLVWGLYYFGREHFSKIWNTYLNAMVTGLLLKSILVMEEWEGCLSEEEGHLWINDCRGIYIKTLNWPYITWSLTSFSPLPSSFTPFISPRLSFHSALHEALSCFPVPLDVIAKTTSPWQQLVTSSSPTLSFDGCFYFGGLVDVARTSLVEQITCSGGEGTMLPSVGSKCLHTANGGSCDDSPQSITWMATRTSHSGSSSLKQTHVNRGFPLERSGHDGASSFDGSRNGKKNMHPHKYVCIDMHVSSICAHMHIYTHVYVCTYTQVYVHAHTHTHNIFSA